MSRNHYYHSPYAGRRASRWPWLFGLLIAVAFAAAGAVLVQGDLIEVPSGIVPGTDGDANANTGAPAASPAPGGLVASLPDPAAAGQPAAQGAPATAASPTPQPRQVVGQGDGTGHSIDFPGQAQGQVAAPAAGTAAPPALSPTQVVELYAQRWSIGDHDGLYDLLSRTAQQATPDPSSSNATRASVTRPG